MPVRPTTDMAKEALFNVLANQFDLDETRVCDLFAGTGNISYEFLSRGAELVIAVDSNYRCTKFISSVIEKLGFENINVIRNDVFRFLRQTSHTFNIIFADPPYKLEGIEKIPGLVFENELLSQEGWLILEHSKDHSFSGYANFFETRTYGSVNFSIFVNGDNH